LSCQKSADEYFNIAIDHKDSNNLMSAFENFDKAIEIYDENSTYSHEHLKESILKLRVINCTYG
jgi:hypothetical protein